MPEDLRCQLITREGPQPQWHSGNGDGSQWHGALPSSSLSFLWILQNHRSMHFWRTLTIVSVPKKSHPTELFSRINITGAETTSFPTSLPTKPSSKKTLTSQWSSSPHVVHQFSQQETTDIKGKRSKASFRHTIRPLRWGSGGADAEGSSRNILVVVVG